MIISFLLFQVRANCFDAVVLMINNLIINLCKLRDEVIRMGVIPAIGDWHELNSAID